MRRKRLSLERSDSHKRSALEYLQSATPTILQEVELNRLNHISNMWKEIRSLLEQINRAQFEASVARFYLDGRKLDLPKVKTVSLTRPLLLKVIDKAPKLLTPSEAQDHATSRVHTGRMLHSQSGRGMS